mgnify:CR=1 FL=1
MNVSEMNEIEFQEFVQQLETNWQGNPLYAVITAVQKLNQHYQNTDWICLSPTCTRDTIAANYCPVCLRPRPDVYRALREYGIHLESDLPWMNAPQQPPKTFDMTDAVDLVRFWIGHNDLSLTDSVILELERFVHNAIQRAKS